jgi:hypothetical protein
VLFVKNAAKVSIPSQNSNKTEKKYTKYMQKVSFCYQQDFTSSFLGMTEGHRNTPPPSGRNAKKTETWPYGLLTLNFLLPLPTQ